MQEIIIDIAHNEQAVIDFDTKEITFLYKGVYAPLKSITFKDVEKIARQIQPKVIPHQVEKQQLKTVPRVEKTDKGFLFLTLNIFQLRDIIHEQDCPICNKMLFDNIKYVGAIQKAFCKSCFNKWHSKVDGGYKWSETENREINRALKNISATITA